MKILSLSTDPELSLYRKRVLEDAGHEVVALNSEREALEQVEAGDKFDVVLICHRLPDATARKVVRLVREGRPQTRIVYVVHIYGEWPEVEADRYVVGADGPDALQRVVRESLAPPAP